MQTLLVFIAVALLSVLASNQRLLQAGRFFELAQLAASGMMFLVFGALLGPGAMNLLTAGDLVSARPLLALGLGLGGLLLGLNLEPHLLRALPRRVYVAAAAQSGFAFLAVAVPMAALFLATVRMAPAVAIGAGAVLGGAASVSSSHLAVLWYRAGRLDRVRGIGLSLLAMLDDLMGVAVLVLALVISAHAQLSVGLGLVALALLLGILCGALTAYLIHELRDPAELTAVLLGAVCLVSGAAAFLRVSSFLAGLACGTTLALIGGKQVAAVYRALAKTERPVYLLMLFLIGAHLHPFNWQAWVFLPAFVALRFVGKIFGARVASRAAEGALQLPPEPGYALVSQGAVSLCLLIQFLLLVRGSSAQLIFDIGVIAAVINEALGSRVFHRSLQTDEVPRTGAPA